MTPYIQFGQFGSRMTMVSGWSNEFNHEPEKLLSVLVPDPMEYDLHKAGNEDIADAGNHVPKVADEKGRMVTQVQPDWWRWSGRYTWQNKTSFVRDGKLVMGACLRRQDNPLRPSVYKMINNRTNQIEKVDWSDTVVYLSYLTTWGPSGNGPNYTTSPDSSNITWGPETYHEMEVDVSGINTQAMPLSWRLMPAYESASDDGIDVFGYDCGLEQQLYMNYGDNGGVIPIIKEIADFSKPFKVGLLWLKDRLVWYVNGYEVHRVNTIVRPSHYYAIAREIHSGAQEGPPSPTDSNNRLQAIPPYIPADPGISGLNAWFDRDKINTDEGRINYVRSFFVTDLNY